MPFVAVHLLVVNDHGHAVAGKLDIQLNAVRTGFDRLAEGKHGIFRIAAAETAVRKIFHVGSFQNRAGFHRL